MSGLSTFGTYTMARLGIYASTQGMSVTGNNIVNINTDGYTRQSLDQFSLHMYAADRYSAIGQARLGAGVVAPSVSQARDQYLDIRYRNATTNVGYMEGLQEGYDHLGSLLDEVGKGDDEAGVLEAMFNDVKSQMSALADEGAGKDGYDTLFRSSMETLVLQINKTAGDLEALRQTRIDKLNEDIDAVNKILEQLRDLNTTIRKNTLYGDNSLEMRDSRNLLLDQLSKYMSIDVTYETEQIAPGVEGDRLIVRTGTQPPRELLYGLYATKLSLRKGSDEGEDPNYDIDLSDLRDIHNQTMVLDDSDDRGVVKNRDIGPLTNEDGETIFYDTEEEAQAAADLRNESAIGTEFRVQRDEETGGIVVHEYGTTIYNTSEDAALALIQIENAREKILDEDTGRVSYTELRVVDEGGQFEIHQIAVFRGEVQLGDTELGGFILADREILTEEGVFSTQEDLDRDPGAAGKRGVPFYQRAMDVLANQMAALLNGANQLPDETIYQTTEVQKTDEDGSPVLDEDGNPVMETAFVDRDGNVTEDRNQYVLKPEYNYYNGGVLLSSDPNTNNETGITAANISISKNWSNGSFRVLRSKQPQELRDDGTPILRSTANENLDYIRNLFTGKHEYTPNNEDIYSKAASTEIFFTGSFQELLTDHIATSLASDNNYTTARLDIYTVNADQLYVDRDGVQGVDLNDEAMQIMSYQKAYTAACRLMTTFDDMLDKLINGTAV